MWNSSSMGGGGFLEGSYSSPGTGGRETKVNDKKTENCVPVTIRQILKGRDDLKIGGIVVNMVTFVALVKNIEITSTKIIYSLEDTTGQIDAIVWVEDKVVEHRPVVNAYARVFGTLRFQQGQTHVLVFKIDMIEDMNELTSHLLEVIDISMSAHITEMEEVGKAPGMNSVQGNQPLANSLMNMNQGMEDGLDAQAPTDPRQRMVFKVIWDASTCEEGGVNLNFIAQKLSSRMNMEQIRQTTEYLLQEGFIFSTIDDEHFTVTR